MDNQHIIEQAVFDISFGSEEEAFEQQADLGDFVKRRLMRVVDEVFDEMSTNGRVFRIDHLEIDLGTVAYNGFQGEMEGRLRERLRSVLREKLPSLRTVPAPNEGVITRERLELEQLEYFLISGRMPWNAVLGKDRTIDQLLQRVVHSTGSQLVEFLKNSPRRDTVVKRLVSQFPEEILAEIVRTLAPSHSGFLTGVVDDLIKIWRKHRFVEATEREFGRWIWEQLIDALLETEGGSFNPQDVVGRIVKRIAARQGMNHSRMLAILTDETAQLEKREGLSPELTGILQTLLKSDEEDQGEIPDDTPPDRKIAHIAHGHGETDTESGIWTASNEERAADIEFLRGRLAKAMVRGDAEGIKDIWPTLLRDQPELLKDALRHYGCQARVRRKIASGFPESMLTDLLRLLEPGASVLIHQIVERPELFRQALSEPTEAAGTLKRRLWEFTFAYLLVEGGSRFNKKAFIGSLIRKMAAYCHIGERDLLRSLDRVLAQTRASDALPRELDGVIGDLLDEMGGAQSAPEDSGSRSRATIHAYDLYETLKQRLLEGESPREGDTGDLTPLIDELAREHPWQLLRLYRELQVSSLSRSGAGERTGATVAATLSTNELGRLIQAFVSLAQPAEGDGLSDLLRAIEAHAGSARNVKQYYVEVLACLVRNQVIDFEAIIAADRSSDEAEDHDSAKAVGESIRDVLDTGEKSEPKHREDETPPPLGDQAEEALGGYLMDDSPTSADETARLLHSIDLMLIRQPARLRRLLERSLQKKEAAARLIELLPERLLTRVLFLLRPAAHHRVQRCADILADACHVKELAVGADRLRRLKWGFIFRHLFEDGLPFEEGRFVRRFVSYLSEETHGADERALRALLSQQVTLNILPSTRERHLAILQALSPGIAGTEGLETEGMRRAVADNGQENLKAPNAVESEPYQGVGDLSNEEGRRQSTAEDTASESRSLIRSYDLYEQLEQRLLQGESPREGDPGDLTPLIDELARVYPWQLLRLCRELQDDEGAGTHAVNALSAEELERLIQAFLLLTLPAGQDEPSDLHRAVQAYAGRATDAKRYYGQVFECLIRNQVIDFEAIIAPHLSPDDDGTPDEVTRDPPHTGGQQESSTGDLEAQAAPPMGQEPEEALASYLKDNGQVAADDAARMCHTIERMLARQPGRLRRVLETLLNRRAAARLIELLPERLLTRVLFLLRPAAHHRVQRCADILADACHVKELAVGADRLRRLKWGFIFRYLFEEGLRFDERRFVQHFVRYLAEETNQAPRTLRPLLSQQLTLNILPSTREHHLAILQVLSPGIAGTEGLETEGMRRAVADNGQENLKAPNAVESEPYQGVGDLSNEEGRRQSAAEDTASESRSLIRSYDLYEQLEQRLLQGESPREGDPGDLTPIIDELARVYPWQLLRLCRELQAGELSGARMVATLSAEELGRLIQGFVSLTQQTGDDDPSDLLRAIEAYAARTTDAKRYYGQVLECLIKNQVIDFEAIIAPHLSPDDDGTPDEVTRNPPHTGGQQESSTGDLEAQAAPPMGQEPEEALASYLKEGGTVSADDASLLMDTIELMLAQQPGQLRRLLEALLDGRAVATRLIDLLPERLLTRLLFLLRAADHHRVQRCADILADACNVKELAVGADRIRRLKWGFIFRYLFEEGLRFDERRFVQHFVRYLAEETNQALGTLRPLLSQQLTLNLLPSTRQHHQAILQVLSGDATEVVEMKRGTADRGVEKPDAPDAVERQADGRVDSLAGERGHMPSPDEETASMSQALIHAYDLYEVLERCLLQGRAPGAGDAGELTAIIDELARVHPWQLLKLYRELQGRDLTDARAAVATLSADELSHLIQAFLSLQQPPGEGEPSDLMAAIDAYSGQTTHAKRYYSQVFECLVQNQIIDFEAIITENLSQVEAEGGDEATGERAPIGTAQAPPIGPLDALANYLKGDGTVSTADAARLIETIERMLARQPRQLQRLLETSLDGREPTTRLIDLLPVRLLTRVLSLLRTTDRGEEIIEASDVADERVDRPSAAPDAESASRAFIRSYDLYEALEQQMLDGVSPGEGGEGDLTAVIDELARAYPWQMLRLYRALQTGDVSVAQAMTVLSAEALDRLIKAFLSLTQQVRRAGTAHQQDRWVVTPLQFLTELSISPTQQAGEDDRHDLIGAVETYATQVRDAKRYYGQLLERLVRNQVIDFEAILAENLPPVEVAGGDGATDEVEPTSETPPPMGEAAEDALARYLKEGYSASTAEVARLSRTIEHLLAQQPGRLRHLLGTSLEERDAATRLIDLLPQRLLSPVVSLLQATADRGRENIQTPDVVPRTVDGHVDSPADARGDRRSAAENAASASRALIHSYDLYEALSQRLLDGALPGEGSEGDLTQVINELARTHPWQLLRLCRKLRAGEFSVAWVSTSLSVGEFSRLIEAFLSVMQQAGEGERSDLTDAIESYAEQARDARRYYGQVLERIILNQVIDFEAIIAENQSSVEAAGGDGATDEVEPTSETLLPMGEAAKDALARYLKEGYSASTAEAARLSRTIEHLLAQQPGRLRHLLGTSLEERDAAARLIDLLPERLLTRVLFLLCAADHHRVQRCADILADACHAEGLAIRADRIHHMKWGFIFRYVFEEGLTFELQTFVQRFATYLAEETNQADVQSFRAMLSEQVTQNALPSTREQHLAIVQALSPETAESSGRRQTRTDETPRPGRRSSKAKSFDLRDSPDEEAEEITEEIYIANAGLVLAAPYLPRLFDMLDLTEASAFKDRKAAERGVHLLQFMVNESTNSPEYQLVLNKILCGVRTGVPIEREIDITGRETEAIEGLIQGMIQNWKVLGNTSIAGFRESFLQREGRLQLKNKDWHLLVEPRAFDMLLDQIPWSFSMVKHSWMERIVHVEWR